MRTVWRLRQTHDIRCSSDKLGCSMRILATMKSFRRLFQFIYLLPSLTFVACVSVNFEGDPPQKSKTAEFTAPISPFHEIESRHLDKSWQNTKTGSTISFLSDCYGAVDPTLDNIFNGILSEIEDKRIIESHNVDYNEREALHSTVEGKVDGIQTRFELMIFKKNNCIYILTYAAKEGAFAHNQRDFLKFVKGFHVP